MARIILLALLLLCQINDAKAQLAAAPNGKTFSPEISLYNPPFFGMHVNFPSGTGASVWPGEINIGLFRLWGSYDNVSSATDWQGLNPSSGVYSWTALDDVMNQVTSKSNVPFLYAFGHTPNWANGNAGVAVLPTNYTSLYNFVSALLSHTAGKITYYEIWNEADLLGECSEPGGAQCTPAHLVTISQNIYSLIKAAQPNAIVLCPSTAESQGPPWFQQFLAAGGAAYCDAFAFHSYPWLASYQVPTLSLGTNPLPEQIAEIYSQYKQVAINAGYPTTPIYDTEGAWSVGIGQTEITNTSKQMAYPAIWQILQYGKSPLTAWFGWDNQTSYYGSLWSSATGILPAGIAYKNVVRWLMNSTVVTPAGRTNGTQLLTNTNATTGITTGTVGGSSPTGTLPTGWGGEFNDAVNGITFTIAGKGTENGIPYFDLNISGTWTGTGTGFSQVIFHGTPYLASSAGQILWQSVHIKLQSGSLANLFAISLNTTEEATSSGTYVSNNVVDYFNPTGLSLDQQIYSGASLTANGPYVYPMFQVWYTSGQPVNATFRIGAPSLDAGSIWTETIRNGQGNNQQIAWATDNAGESLSTSYNYYYDLYGVRHSVTGNAVTLTNMPVLLSNQ